MNSTERGESLYNPPAGGNRILAIVPLVSAVVIVAIGLWRTGGKFDSSTVIAVAVVGGLTVVSILAISIGPWLSVRDLRRQPGILDVAVYTSLPGLSRFFSDQALSTGGSISQPSMGLLALTSEGVEFRRILRSDEVLVAIPWARVANASVGPIASGAPLGAGTRLGIVLGLENHEPAARELALPIGAPLFGTTRRKHLDEFARKINGHRSPAAGRPD